LVEDKHIDRESELRPVRNQIFHRAGSQIAIVPRLWPFGLTLTAYNCESVAFRIAGIARRALRFGRIAVRGARFVMVIPGGVTKRELPVIGDFPGFLPVFER
jgi:hypothetical protein